MKALITITFIVSFITLHLAAEESLKNFTTDLNLNKPAATETSAIKWQELNAEKDMQQITPASLRRTTEDASVTTSMSFLPPLPMPTSSPLPETVTISSNASPLTSSSALTATATLPPTTVLTATSNQYCSPSLCAFFNGSHTNIQPHIACKNSGNCDPGCGLQPHLLKMSERRRNLILDLHNLARSHIASGQVVGYESASHMPQLKWDNELEYLASLHVKRCRFEHDLCHNTIRFPYSGQNIGYFWKGANITSHTKRIKKLIADWYQEHKDANQSYIDSFHLHPDNKAIGHFTTMVGDRVHHVGCAVIRFYNSNLTQILMTCNYDYNNFENEPVFQSGPAASQCAYKESAKYPGLCDWTVPAYEYLIEDVVNTLQ